MALGILVSSGPSLSLHRRYSEMQHWRPYRTAKSSRGSSTPFHLMLYNKNSVSSEALILSIFRYSISGIKSQTVPCCFVHGSPVFFG
jgi:hypothetical protein